MPVGSVQSSQQSVARPGQALRMGAEGPAVRRLQEQLNRLGARPALKLDGDFGPKTDAAVRAFQAANAPLTVDGIVGPRTREVLDSGRARPIPATPAQDAPSGPTRRDTGYRNGRPFPLTLVSIGDGEWLSERAGAQFNRMKAHAARDGVDLNVVSGFRTMDEQRALYAAYRAGRGNLAAAPGYSNHQNGIAVDITTNGSRNHPAYRWLARNAGEYGFRNTVASEPWHWEYRG